MFFLILYLSDSQKSVESLKAFVAAREKVAKGGIRVLVTTTALFDSCIVDTTFSSIFTVVQDQLRKVY